MKYIYYILAFLFIVSVLIGIELKSKKTTEDIAIRINDRVITSKELKSLYESQQPYKQPLEDFINALITKELLIQESKKMGIDKEETFRRSIQNFYEQSLIKQLIDRKISSASVTISENELNNYISLMNKKYHVSIFSFNNPEEAERSTLSQGEKKIFLFDDMSEEIRGKITNLKTGEHTLPIKSGEKYIVIRVDKIEELKGAYLNEKDREKIKDMLLDEKKKNLINEWISSMRARAKIEVMNIDALNKTGR